MEREDIGKLNDLVYRLGAIEAKIEANKTNWVEPVRHIQELLSKVEQALDKDLVLTKENVATNKKTIEALEEKVRELEKDLSLTKTKISTAAAAIGVFWLVFGNNIQQAIERLIT